MSDGSYTSNISLHRFRTTRVCFWRPPCTNRGGSRFRPRTHCVLAPTVYESGWEAVTSRLGWNYKPTPIKTYRNPADRLCVAGIGSSDFRLADLVSGGYCDFPRFVQILQSARLPCQLNSNPVCILIFFGRDPFSIGITFYIHHFFIYTFKSTTKNSAPLFV